LKDIKDEDGNDIGILGGGGRFSKRYLNVSGESLDLGNQDFILSEFEPSKKRLERHGKKHSEFLKELGLPSDPIICIDENRDWVEAADIDAWKGNTTYLDTHYTFQLGFDLDSIPALSAKIVLHCHLALSPKSDDPMMHAFIAGEACALHEVYYSYEFGQLKKGGTRKSKKNQVLVALLRHLLIEDPRMKSQELMKEFSEQHQEIELEIGDIEFWCEENPFYVYVSLDGEESARFSARTFRDYVKNVKAGLAANSQKE
jgi:hypothetical protein